MPSARLSSALPLAFLLLACGEDDAPTGTTSSSSGAAGVAGSSGSSGQNGPGGSVAGPG